MSDSDIQGLRIQQAKQEGHNDLMENKVGSIDSRLSNIESTLTWLVRLVIGALILAVVGFAMKGGLVIG